VGRAGAGAGAALIEATESGIRLRLRVQPRASRTELAGVMGDRLRVRLAAPPVDGAANEALVRWLAERLGVARGVVRVVSGQTGRNKVVAVAGIGVAEARARLLPAGSP
jgi:uncharacterized protein (TIGR00251 family)